jgi:cobalt/nickel transport system permease protein
VLAAPVLIAGAGGGLTLLAVALRRLDYERIPQAAVLAAAFFLASLVSVPLGPASVHLIFNGLMGLVLGWVAVPAILVGLLLQALFFGHGGLLALGVNLMNLAVPALVCAALLGALLRQAERGRRAVLIGAASGAIAALLTGVMVSLSLAASGSELMPAARILLATYVLLALVEGAVTAAVVGFLWRVAPELLLPSEEVSDG